MVNWSLLTASILASSSAIQISHKFVIDGDFVKTEQAIEAAKKQDAQKSAEKALNVSFSAALE